MGFERHNKAHCLLQPQRHPRYARRLNNSVTYSCKADSGDRLQVPFGLIVGCTIGVGGKGHALDLSLGAYSLVTRPEGGADWKLKLGISLFFP